MKVLKTEWTGIRPLIMTNPQTVKISNEFATMQRKLSREMKAARRKGEEDKMVDIETKCLRVDWESSAYWDNEKKHFFIPDTLIMAGIRAGACANRKGKDIDRAVLLSETHAYVQTKNFASLDAAFNDKGFRMECPCRIPPKTGSLIWKARCMIPTGWKLKFSLEFDETVVTENSLKEAIQTCGSMVGIGGWRPKFGRFTVEF